MKKLIVALAFLLSLTHAFAQGKKNTPRYSVPGFRDLKWGAHIDSIYKDGSKLNFLKSEISKDPNAYYLENEDLSIGTVALTHVIYYFTDRGKFTKVILRGDKKFFTDMKYILTYKFDEPQAVKQINGNNVSLWNVDDVKISITDANSQDYFMVEFSVDYNLMEFRTINRNVTDF